VLTVTVPRAQAAKPGRLRSHRPELRQMCDGGAGDVARPTAWGATSSRAAVAEAVGLPPGPARTARAAGGALRGRRG
jgi:hypothetical protein